jgi:hypothetical protein
VADRRMGDAEAVEGCEKLVGRDGHAGFRDGTNGGRAFSHEIAAA